MGFIESVIALVFVVNVILFFFDIITPTIAVASGTFVIGLLIGSILEKFETFEDDYYDDDENDEYDY